MAASSEFRIFETAEFRNALPKLAPPPFLRRKLDTYVYPQLRKQPFYGPNIRKLKGYETATWRYRIGPYRVFYCVDQPVRIVFILSVDDRKDAYR